MKAILVTGVSSVQTRGVCGVRNITLSNSKLKKNNSGSPKQLFMMIGASIQYCHCPIYLLYKDKAYHLMREGHFRH